VAAVTPRRKALRGTSVSDIARLYCVSRRPIPPGPARAARTCDIVTDGWPIPTSPRATSPRVYTSGGADLVVFSELNLEVERGEMLALVGEIRAGKSTLLHSFGRFGQAFERHHLLRRDGDFALTDSEQADSGIAKSGSCGRFTTAAGVYGAGERDDAVADSRLAA